MRNPKLVPYERVTDDVVYAIGQQLSYDAWKQSIEENLIITTGGEIAHWTE